MPHVRAWNVRWILRRLPLRGGLRGWLLHHWHPVLPLREQRQVLLGRGRFLHRAPRAFEPGLALLLLRAEPRRAQLLPDRVHGVLRGARADVRLAATRGALGAIGKVEK